MEKFALQFDQSALAVRLLGRPAKARPAFDVADVRDDVRERARIAWEERTRMEYGGMVIMRHFHALLVEANAPLDWQEAALTLALHEQRHARLCMNAASALGSNGLLTFDPGELTFEMTGASFSQSIVAMLCSTFCTGEVVALELLLDANRALPVSGFRSLLRSIAKDEVSHARVGPLWLAEIRAGRTSFIDYPGDAWVRAQADKCAAQMRARDLVAPEDEALFADAQSASQMRRLGISDPERFRNVFTRALTETVPAAFAKAGVLR